ncbi:leucyl/phenylalanyl-tRNA/protein transferase [Candidatus Nitrosoglobus terrae]|uniref:Leucyl/phenylalanyl-tRNA--protein transferase n=1 Tax=Candidatus Nitrosoglobus terrae TaxID=1630141 RepID=A0A1Q2SPK0_9GAMM|nr:leucyl/phenylalanyl-tRNA--protein transferase [Candidatus Nitrosoglobus terrae]BAW81052.1 leucyl/phenylalanyl-tRNA/protein transferase [Candidatus Nitrosoglobus terrae]
MSRLYYLDPHGPANAFPNPELALTDPNGLLAVGGDLSVERIIAAYQQGIFPWYSEGQPILWWSPDPRMVLFPEKLHISRSLQKQLRRETYQVTLDQDFLSVIQACASSRSVREGTWITPEIKNAYLYLHQMGIAHSAEAWKDGKLAGGLYGLSIGYIFFGESMFSRYPDASKVAFVHLCRQLQRWGFPLIDCQVESAHLQRLGAETISRSKFLYWLQKLCNHTSNNGLWHLDHDLSI